MGEVVLSPFADMPAEKVLAAAAAVEFSNVIVIGRTRDGEFYAAASQADAKAILWDLDMAKRVLLAATKRAPGEV